jgi:D-alanine transaminase
MQLAMIEDNIVPLQDLKEIYLDRGFYFGDGVYEVIRSYNGKIFALDEHLERLKRSLSEIKITAVDINQIRSKINSAFVKADIKNAKIYFQITRGSAIRNHTWDTALKPSLFLTITQLPTDNKEKTEGIALATHPDWRWKRCDIKSLNLLPNVLARQYAAEKGCAEAILVNDDGLITEGAASTFFAIIDKILQTTPLTANILPSITRKYVFKTARNIGLQIKEKKLTPQQAIQADELFIAVTTKDIVPVVKFDDQIIGDGKPGKLTKYLMQQFLSFTR